MGSYRHAPVFLGSPAIAGQDGFLSIDLTTKPPSYAIGGGTTWMATVSDPDGNSFQSPVAATWADGTGTTTPDGGGIMGTNTQQNAGVSVMWTCQLTRSIPCAGISACAKTVQCAASTCNVGCTANNTCAGDVTCAPTSSTCNVVCGGVAACAGKVTSGATTSTLCCNGTSACIGAVTCGKTACNASCLGASSCGGGVTCNASTCVRDASTCP